MIITMANKKYPLRRESLLSPWGVGSTVPFPGNESLMVAGLNFWFKDVDMTKVMREFEIVDERLSSRLGGKRFVSPPDFRERYDESEFSEFKIRSVRFPRWHYCPVCGNMEKVGPVEVRPQCKGDIRQKYKDNKETYCSQLVKKYPNRLRTAYLVPERFIAVCEEGHIEDFPIMEWVHIKSNKVIDKENCKLRRSTGGISSSLSGVTYHCTCGATASMAGAFNQDALKTVIGYTCQGVMPWLGKEIGSGNEKCGKSLLVLQRGASNVWFADLISSLYIPNIENIINSKNDNFDISEEEYRKQEFKVLIKTKSGSPKEELFCIKKDIKEDDKLPFLNGISLVHKLRETRVFNGFKRISPNSNNAPITLNKNDWLPAVKNSGEGIMFEFKYGLLEKWANKPNVLRRINQIEKNLRLGNVLSDDKQINPIYVLLHTFAHTLINALSLECGYSNASIRERIYCSKYINDKNIPMAGVLIYTASGDSEGSLGGLVRQGVPERIQETISRAINEARWCAADPVCIQSEGQGQNGCNLASCHNCSLLPETSCENKNMLLDRALMIGTLTDQTMGFFNDYEW